VTGEVEQSGNQPFGQLSFAQLREGATAIISEAQLEKDKARLLGIPHIVTRLTYRPGIEEKDYVSVEAVTADIETLEYEVKRGRVPNVSTLADLLVEPNEKIIYNDGSTAARRQFTMILHNLGLIEVPGVQQDMAVFDTPYWDWTSFSQVGFMNGENDEKIEVPDFTLSPSGAPLAILVDHGLRISVFPNPTNPKVMSECFYLS
jgi:hypothetical protein